MSYNFRKNKIMELLADSEEVKKQELVEALSASPSTIQRDLIQMEQEGLLFRHWGGARRIADGSIYKRNIIHERITSPMKIIGELAASKVKDGELIFLGAGKTTLAMAEYISAENITVITNGIPQLEVLTAKNISVFLLCGFFKEYSRSVVGRQTIKMLSTYRFDRAFCGARGMDENYRPISADEYEFEIKNICIQNAREVYVLVDHSKFDRTGMYVVPGEQAQYLNVITDQPVYGNGKFAHEKNGYIWKKTIEYNS